MRTPAIVVGILLLVVGGFVASGLFKFEKTERVVDLGPVEINKTEEKKVPLNAGYILLAIGALVLVAGAASKK